MLVQEEKTRLEARLETKLWMNKTSISVDGIDSKIEVSGKMYYYKTTVVMSSVVFSLPRYDKHFPFGASIRLYQVGSDLGQKKLENLLGSSKEQYNFLAHSINIYKIRKFVSLDLVFVIYPFVCEDINSHRVSYHGGYVHDRESFPEVVSIADLNKFNTFAFSQTRIEDFDSAFQLFLKKINLH